MIIDNIITDKMIFGGECLAKNSGKAVLIPYTVPGERLSVEITGSKRDYDTAVVSEIITPSPHRVTPPCPLYGKCGGCNMMHIDPEYQKQLRKSVLRDAFERCGVKVPEIECISGNSLHYRCRFQLHNGGLSERASNSIIPITSCAVAEDTVNEYFAATPVENRPHGRIQLYGSSKAEKTIVAEETERESESVTPTQKNKIHHTVKKHYSGTVISEDSTAEVTILGKKIKFDVRGFFQSNLEVLEKSIPHICAGNGENALDMYSGCGTFSVFLAEHYKNITLVEHNRDALVFAEQNLTGASHKSFGMSGEKWVQLCSKTAPRFDCVVVDPPRSGMENAVCAWLGRSEIPQIHSVSCDPATHARDASKLISAGYKLEKLYLLDFYPHTSHIESLAWFTL